MTKNIESNTLNETIERLTRENLKWREQFDEVLVEIRRRAPNADGLTVKGAVKVILDDRDRFSSRIQHYREQIRKMLKLLLDGRIDDAKKEINIFLFNNKD